jgi:hypothetical protein
MIDAEMQRLRRQWTPEELLHRRALAARRQLELATLLGLDTTAAQAAAEYWKRFERAGIARLQRAKEADRRANRAAPEAEAAESTPIFHQGRRGGVLPRYLVVRRDGPSRLRARPVAPADLDQA